MELERQRAWEIAERVTEIGPCACRVNLFSAEEIEGGRYMARVSVELGGDPTEPADLPGLIEQIHVLHTLAEAEGLQVKIVRSLNVVLLGKD